MRPHLMPPAQVVYIKSREDTASTLLTTGCFKCIICAYHVVHMRLVIHILKHAIESTETHEAHMMSA